MTYILQMSDVIKLLNGRSVTIRSGTDEHAVDASTVKLRMHREDTSITSRGSIERIEGEWKFTLED